MATSRLLGVKFDDAVEACRLALMKNGVHQGGDLELNSCLHRQPVKTLSCMIILMRYVHCSHLENLAN